MAFPTTGVLDTFTGTDGTTPPNANWTNNVRAIATESGLEINTNQARSDKVGTSDYGDAWWNATQFGPDQEVYATLSGWNNADANSELALWLRLQSPGVNGAVDGYFAKVLLVAGTDTVGIWRVDNSAFTALGTTINQEFAQGDKFGFEVIGSTLSVYRHDGTNWTNLGSRTDTTYNLPGYIGLLNFHGTTGVAKADDFGGGNVLPESPPDLMKTRKPRFIYMRRNK